MPLENILVVFTKGTSEECQQNGEAEVQWNPELSLEIALHVGSHFFLSTNSMEAYSCVSNHPCVRKSKRVLYMPYYAAMINLQTV